MKTSTLKAAFLTLSFALFINVVSATTGWYQDYIFLNVNGTGSSYYWIGADPLVLNLMLPI